MVSRNKSELEKVAAACNRKAGKILAHAIPFDLNDLDNLEVEFLSRLKAHTDTIDALVQ